MTKTVWLGVFPWELGVEPEGKTRSFLQGICLHDVNPGPRHTNELKLVLQKLTNHHPMLISRKQQSIGLGKAYRGEGGAKGAGVSEVVREGGSRGHSRSHTQCLTQTKALFTFHQCLRQSTGWWRGRSQPVPREGLVRQGHGEHSQSPGGSFMSLRNSSLHHVPRPVDPSS